jgi:threonine dehydrogenase-like Zn-dependent dehydrogenase
MARLTSRASVQVGDRRIEVQTLPVPDELPPGSALLRVEATGICGTDVSQYDGYVRQLMGYDYPVILGHEAVGHLVAVTPEAEAGWGLRVGDRVAVEPSAVCGHCVFCREHEPTLCTERLVYGFVSTDTPPGLWGAYAEYMVLHRDSRLFPMPASMPVEDACLFNAFAGGFDWGAVVPETQPGDDVVIIGPGLRALASVIAAKEAGARNVIVVGRARNPRKIEIAEAFGATHFLRLDADDVSARVREITGGLGAHRVIDYVPHRFDTFELAIDVARPGGTLVPVGFKGKRHPFLLDLLCHKKLTVRGVTGPSPEGYDRGIAALLSGRYPLELLHTDRFTFDRAEDAILTLAGRVEGRDPICITVTA